MAEWPPGTTWYHPTDAAAEFVRNAQTPLPGEPLAHFAALHTWRVEQPASASSAPGGAVAPGLHLLLQLCDENGSPTCPSDDGVPVLRLPADAWAHPAALRACASPQRDCITVNGRPFLTALRALGTLSPWCDECARKAGSSTAAQGGAAFAMPAEAEEAAAELWAAVAANAAQHHQPPEEALLLMTALKAARLAGESDADPGHLPGLEAYEALSLDEGELEREHRDSCALKLLAAVALQLTDLLQGRVLASAAAAGKLPAGRLRLAALQALTLLPRAQEFGGRALLAGAIAASGMQLVEQALLSDSQQPHASRATLRALGHALQFTPDPPEVLCMLGMALVLDAFNELPRPCEPAGSAPRTSPLAAAARPGGSEPVPECTRHAGLKHSKPAGAPLSQGAASAASDLAVGLELMLRHWQSRNPKGQRGAESSLDLFARLYQRLLDSPLGAALIARHSTATRDSEPVPPGGDSAEPGSAQPDSAEPAWVWRVLTASWLASSAFQFLQALPREYLAAGQDITLAARTTLPLPDIDDPASPALERGACTASPPPAAPPAPRMAAPPVPRAAAPPPQRGSTVLLAPSHALCCDARVTIALGGLFFVLEAALSEAESLPAQQPRALGQLLAPLLANRARCEVSHKVLRVLCHLHRTAPAGPQVWDGLRIGLAACGYHTELDMLHALLLTGALDAHRASADADTVNAAAASSLAFQEQLVESMQMALQLAGAAASRHEGGAPSGSSVRDCWEEQAKRARPGAKDGIIFHLWQALRCAQFWRRHAAAASARMRSSAQTLGELAIGMMQTFKPTSSKLTSEQDIQVLMSFLVAITKAPSHPPPPAVENRGDDEDEHWDDDDQEVDEDEELLDQTLQLLESLDWREDVAAAVARAQGVPRLLHALAQTRRLRSHWCGAVSAVQALRALWTHGPPGTVDTLVACRGVQAIVRHTLLPPSTELAPDAARDHNEALGRAVLCWSWLTALECGCAALQTLVEGGLAAAQQLWGTLAPELPTLMECLAGAGRAPTNARVHEQALALWTLLQRVDATLRLHTPHCHVLDAARRSFKSCGFSAIVAGRASKAKPSARARGACSAAAPGPPESADGSAAAAADAAMQALLQEEEEQRARPAAAGAKSSPPGKGRAKRRHKGSVRGAAAHSDAPAGAPAAGEPVVTAPRDSTDNTGALQQPAAVVLERGAPQSQPPPSHAAAALGASVALPEASPNPPVAPSSACQAHSQSGGEASECTAAAAAMPAHADGKAEPAEAFDVQELLHTLLSAPAQHGPVLSAQPLPVAQPASPRLHACSAPGDPTEIKSPPAAVVPPSQPGRLSASTLPLPEHVHASTAASCPASIPWQQHGADDWTPRLTDGSASSSLGRQLDPGGSQQGGTAAASSRQLGGSTRAHCHVPSAALAGTGLGEAGSGGIPAELEYLLCCPITQEPMEDPVICTDGHTYERSAIEDWLGRSATSPLTGQALADTWLTPNHALRSMIHSLRQL